MFNMTLRSASHRAETIHRAQRSTRRATDQGEIIQPRMARLKAMSSVGNNELDAATLPQRDARGNTNTSIISTAESPSRDM
jgi:hypothetical protein